MVPDQGKEQCDRPISTWPSVLFVFSATNWVYWRNPVQSGIIFGVSLSMIITFMFLSALAAISFWSLAFLILSGLYKLYNYLMATFVGRVQDDLLEYERKTLLWTTFFTGDIFLDRSFHLMCTSPNDKPKLWPIRFARTERVCWNKDAAFSSGIISPLLLSYDLPSFVHSSGDPPSLCSSLVLCCSSSSTLVCRWTHWHSPWLVSFSSSRFRRSIRSIRWEKDALQPFIARVRSLLFKVPIDRAAKQVLDQINQLLAKWVSFSAERKSQSFDFSV